MRCETVRQYDKVRNSLLLTIKKGTESGWVLNEAKTSDRRSHHW